MSLQAEPEVRATKSDTDLASHPALGFLDLPGEVRNQIYAIAVADRDAASKDDAGYIGFLGTCTQIRAELLPLYYSKKPARYVVQVHDLLLFVQILFLNTDILVPRPSRVEIEIDRINIHKGFKWDIEAFIKATPKIRGIKWRILILGLNEKEGTVDRFAEAIKRAIHLPLPLLKDFETGYVSSVSFEHPDAWGQNRPPGDLWTLTVARPGDWRRPTDRDKLDEYRRFFPNCVFLVGPTHMS